MPPCCLQKKNVWEHSPTRKKNGKGLAYITGRFNAIALPPQSYYQGPLTRGPFNRQPFSHHVAPLTGVYVDLRGPAWPPATCPRPVRHLRLTWARAALPRGLACRVPSARVPRATSACPACAPSCHISTAVSADKTIPFSNFLIRKLDNN